MFAEITTTAVTVFLLYHYKSRTRTRSVGTQTVSHKQNHRHTQTEYQDFFFEAIEQDDMSIIEDFFEDLSDFEFD